MEPEAVPKTRKADTLSLFDLMQRYPAKQSFITITYRELTA